MAYVLETQELTKVYGEKAAISNVSLHVPEGKIYGLIGRNGAGKTTVMRIISGLSNATSGTYTLFGKSGAERGQLMREVGVLIENPGRRRSGHPIRSRKRRSPRSFLRICRQCRRYFPCCRRA